jgi:hypothetical protein
MRTGRTSRRGAKPQSDGVHAARWSPPIGLHALLLAAALLPASCADEEGDTALDLELTPDPALGSAELLAAQIDTVLLVVDSPEGLYLPSEAQVVGNVQIKNVDSDIFLELVVTVPVPSGRLPWIRLRRGGLPDDPLDIRVTGLHTTGTSVTTMALGRVQGLRFTAGATQPVTVPFNVDPDLLPPRVLQVAQTGGKRVDRCRVEQIAIVFSRPIEATSLQEAGAVVVTSDEVAGSVTVAGLRLDSSGLVATFEPQGLEDPVAAGLSYQVSVATVVRGKGSDGMGFDQDPGRAGPQQYEADFSVLCSDPPTAAINVCGSGIADPPPVCPGGNRLACIADQCRPASCEAQCPERWACVATTGKIGRAHV